MKGFIATLALLLGSQTALAHLSPGYVNFGNIPCQSRATQSVTFFNNSNEEVTYVYTSISGSAFTVLSQCHWVPAYSSCTMQVTYWPNQPGSDFGTLMVDTSRGSYSSSLNGSCRQ